MSNRLSVLFLSALLLSSVGSLSATEPSRRWVNLQLNYDSDPQRIRGWLSVGNNNHGVNGVMYTTWTGNFDHLEAFAEAAWEKE